MSLSNSFLRLAGIFLLAATFLTTVSAADFRYAKDPIPGQYIVVLNEEAASMQGEPPGHRGNGPDNRPDVAQVATRMARANQAEVRQTSATSCADSW
jgi:serine protease